MNPNDKFHHYLIVGEIVFQEEGQESVAAIRVNGVMMDPEKEIPVRLLGKAQQILQLNFMQRMAQQKIKVVDVVLMNFVYLGHMNQEEFQKVPEGVKVQEKKETPFAEPVVDLDQAVAEADKQGASNEPDQS